MMQWVRLLWLVLPLGLALPAQATGLIPLAGLYYDNINDVGVTVGAANLTDRHEWDTSGYYADITYNRQARQISMGVASNDEWGLFRGGFTFMQVIDDSRHQNYLGISFTYSTYQLISLKLALFSQVANPADVRPMLAIGVGM